MKVVFITIFFLVTILSNSSMAANESSVEGLQKEVETLKEQVKTLAGMFKQLSNNQKLIAKEVGLISEPKKYSGPITLDYSVLEGDKNVKIVIMEFTDLQCPYCKQHQQLTYPKLKADFIEKGDVLYANNHYPLSSIHPQAFEAAKYLKCADDQGAYSKAKESLFKKGKSIQNSDYESIPGLSDLNKKELMSCVKSDETESYINNSIALAKKIGIEQTPSFVVGLKKGDSVVDWQVIGGAASYEAFAKEIEILQKR